jgi:hypothetical protein
MIVSTWAVNDNEILQTKGCNWRPPVVAFAELKRLNRRVE